VRSAEPLAQAWRQTGLFMETVRFHRAFCGERPIEGLAPNRTKRAVARDWGNDSFSGTTEPAPDVERKMSVGFSERSCSTGP
jgi:hypothetical protein